MFMKKIGKSARFGGLRNLGFMLILAMGLIGMLPRISAAGVIPADEASANASLRAENITKIQDVLERKKVAAQLSDYGLTPDEVNARLDKLSDEQITELAAHADQINAGGDAVGLVVGVLVIVLLVLLVLWLIKYDNTEIVQSKK